MEQPYRYVIDTKETIYRTHEYTIKGDLVFFKDKFNAEVIVNLNEIRKIRETKEWLLYVDAQSGDTQ